MRFYIIFESAPISFEEEKIVNSERR